MNNHGEPLTTGELHEPPADDATPRPSRVRRALSAPGRLVDSWIEADGAKASGLSSLTYTTICNSSVDAALAVALASTLFFSATTGESREGVALYLLVTIAPPFAVIAPLVGPALDRVYAGRRFALSLTFAARIVLTVWLLTNFHSWVLYPAALGIMVMSKSFGVLKSSVTPRLMPPDIDLVRTNARLTILGHIVGSGVVGAIAAGVSFLFTPREALWVVIVIALMGLYSCVLIPRKAESSPDEWATTSPLTVPGTPLTEDSSRDDDPTADVTTTDADTAPTQESPSQSSPRRRAVRQRVTRAAQQLHIVPFPHDVKTCLWSVMTSRSGTGFLTIFVAFAAKSTHGLSAWEQLAMLAVAGAAGSVGTFSGNLLGARIPLGAPRVTVLTIAGIVWAGVIYAAIWPGLIWTAVATFALSLSSSLCKVSLDATIQEGLPEEARSSAFGRSETFGQLAWVFGGTMGIILPPQLGTGFIALSIIIGVGYLRTLFLAVKVPHLRRH
ncbi:MAG: MFS transporter [Corynebacterium kroppenstedtii]|nr:MFS transporter [Corynebacterium kroppenstedtii]